MWARRPGAWQDLAGAVLLAALLCAVWSVQNWPALGALHLPDTDDAVRLQQIRDWLAGQRFGDLAQHRLGAPPGLEMHWSRLADLGPTAIIRLIEPWMGRTPAELTAVILWPALLFAAALALTARIERRLGGSGATAATALVVGAIAFPATTVFLPGRIDHHGLQMVLVLLGAHQLLCPPTRSSGAVLGLVTAASLAIGLETAPLFAAIAAVLVADWVRGGDGATARLTGFGVALVTGLTFGGLTLRTSGWDYPACDGFTRQLWQAAILAAPAPLLLGLAGDRVTGLRARGIAAALVCGTALAGALAVSPGCLHPYGAVDPLLARAWLSRVAEAQPLLRAAAEDAIGYAGLMLVGLGASAVLAWRTRERGWLVLLTIQVAALAVTVVQLRGAYAGALLAVPPLAVTVASARRRGLPALLAAWIASAGIAYPLLGRALPREAGGAGAAVASCDLRDTIGRLQTLPPGRMLASIDLGAHALAETRHQVIAAPYHRNTAGNRALLSVLQAPAPEAARTLRRWRIDYLALCPADIRDGAMPGWLTPVAEMPGGARLYRVTRQ